MRGEITHHQSSLTPAHADHRVNNNKKLARLHFLPNWQTLLTFVNIDWIITDILVSIVFSQAFQAQIYNSYYD